MATWRKYFAFFFCFAFLPFQNCNEFESGNGTVTSYDGEQIYASVEESRTQVGASSIASQDLAMTIYQRLGTKVSVDDPQITAMRDLIVQGRLKDAAMLATNNDNFYNVVVRDFAAKMSNREERVSVQLNDFTATIIGAARDDLDARTLLTGDYYYWAPSSGTNIPSNETNDVIKSNAHFRALDTQHVNLAKSLVKNDQQKIIDNGGAATPLTDAAGVITSRAFMSAHAINGTNRRLVQFSFRQFMCAPIEEWADTTIPGDFVGRDIPRNPQELYESRCAGCHAPMDALRPAFAHVDFIINGNDAYTQYKKVTSNDPNPNNANLFNIRVPPDEQLVPSKFRRGKETFYKGYIVRNDNWENLTSSKFNWRSSTSGTGMKGFGQMLSESRAFSECMVKRVYSAICYEDFPKERADLLDNLAEHFESKNYSLKELFSETVIQEECTGSER